MLINNQNLHFYIEKQKSSSADNMKVILVSSAVARQAIHIALSSANEETARSSGDRAAYYDKLNLEPILSLSLLCICIKAQEDDSKSDTHPNAITNDDLQRIKDILSIPDEYQLAELLTTDENISGLKIDFENYWSA